MLEFHKTYTFRNIASKIRFVSLSPLKHKVGGRWNIRSAGIRETIDGKEIGPSNQTIENWIGGAPATRKKVGEMVTVLNVRSNLAAQITVADFSDEVSIEEFSKRFVLGGAFDDIQKHWNRLAEWGEKYIAGEAFTLSNAADQVIESDCSGLYLVHRKSLDGTSSPSSPRSMELRLAVTYVAPVSTKTRDKNRRFLECRLTVPSIEGSRRFQYRGYFSHRRLSVMTWLFFEEESARPDMITMMTDIADFKHKTPIVGRMLTATPAPYRAVAYEVRIEWYRKFNSIDDIEQFLGGAPLTKEAPRRKLRR